MGRLTKINIKQRYKPFSHRPGAMSVIPFTDWFVKAYPTRIEISDFFNDTILIELNISGPVVGFTLEQDLERGESRIFGTAKEGYFEFHLFVDRKEESLALRYARGDGIVIFVDGKKVKLLATEVLDLIDAEYKEGMFSHCERISLGSHKKQDVEAMWRRLELQEILPLMYFASQRFLIPPGEEIHELPQDEESFSHFIETGFSSLFLPLRGDLKYRGLACEVLSGDSSPLYRLKALQIAFRSLFIQESKGKVSLLPNLPKGFSSGRFIGAKVEGAIIDFEWRKGKLRSVVIHADSEGTINFNWPKEITSYRLGNSRKSQKMKPLLKVAQGSKTVVDKFMR